MLPSEKQLNFPIENHEPLNNEINQIKQSNSNHHLIPQCLKGLKSNTQNRSASTHHIPPRIDLISKLSHNGIPGSNHQTKRGHIPSKKIRNFSPNPESIGITHANSQTDIGVLTGSGCRLNRDQKNIASVSNGEIKTGFVSRVKEKIELANSHELPEPDLKISNNPKSIAQNKETDISIPKALPEDDNTTDRLRKNPLIRKVSLVLDVAGGGRKLSQNFAKISLNEQLNLSEIEGQCVSTVQPSSFSSESLDNQSVNFVPGVKKTHKRLSIDKSIKIDDPNLNSMPNEVCRTTTLDLKKEIKDEVGKNGLSSKEGHFIETEISYDTRSLIPKGKKFQGIDHVNTKIFAKNQKDLHEICISSSTDADPLNFPGDKIKQLVRASYEAMHPKKSSPHLNSIANNLQDLELKKQQLKYLNQKLKLPTSKPPIGIKENIPIFNLTSNTNSNTNTNTNIAANANANANTCACTNIGNDTDTCTGTDINTDVNTKYDSLYNTGQMKEAKNLKGIDPSTTKSIELNPSLSKHKDIKTFSIITLAVKKNQDAVATSNAHIHSITLPRSIKKYYQKHNNNKKSTKDELTSKTDNLTPPPIQIVKLNRIESELALPNGPNQYESISTSSTNNLKKGHNRIATNTTINLISTRSKTPGESIQENALEDIIKPIVKYRSKSTKRLILARKRVKMVEEHPCEISITLNQPKKSTEKKHKLRENMLFELMNTEFDGWNAENDHIGLQSPLIGTQI